MGRAGPRGPGTPVLELCPLAAAAGTQLSKAGAGCDVLAGVVPAAGPGNLSLPASPGQASPAGLLRMMSL